MERGPIPFSPFFHGHVHRDTLYLADGSRPEVTVVDGAGQLVRRIPTLRSAVSADHAYDTLEAELASRELPNLQERLKGIPRQDSVPHFATFLIADDGRIWGKRYDPGTDALWLTASGGGAGGDWWVMNRNGEVEAEIALPARLRPVDVSGRRLLGVRRGELDVESVVLYRLVK